MLKIGIVVASVICAYQGWTGLHKGFLLYGGILFFGFSVITVVFMGNLWVIEHLGVLSHGTLAGFTWLSILLKRPFTAEYAKQYMDPQVLNTPEFIRKNNFGTAIWATAFTVSLVDAILKLTLFPNAGVFFEIIDNFALLAAALYTTYVTKKAASGVVAS